MSINKYTQEIIKRYEFCFKKRFGQNFLIDDNVVRKIIDVVDISDDDKIIEIGPGIGTLTQFLCRTKNFTAIELDNHLVKILNEILPNVNVINMNALDYDFNIADAKVVSNLPYYISTEIITKLLQSCGPKLIVVMVQKEVAQRLTATVGSKNYSSISLFVDYFAKTKTIANVSANCFMPKPKVDSTVIALYPRRKFHIENEDVFLKLIRAAFAKRRKTLVNCLENFCGVNKQQVIEILNALQIDINVRGEALSLEDFAAISNFFIHHFNS